MSPRKSCINKIPKVMARVAPKYGAVKVGIFGSLVDGKFRKDSDIDILVKFADPIGMIDFLKMEGDLSRSLGRKVDLVTENSLSPHFRKDVINNLLVVYEK